MRPFERSPLLHAAGRRGSVRSTPSGAAPDSSRGWGLLMLLLPLLVAVGVPANAAQRLSSAELQCTRAVSQSVGRLQSRLLRHGHRKCLRAYQRGRLEGTLEACLFGDPKGMVESVRYDPGSRTEKHCRNAPASIKPDPDAITLAGIHSSNRVWRDIFGGNLDEQIATMEGDPAMARCQRSLARGVRRCAVARSRTVKRCQSRGSTSVESLEQCITEAASRSCRPRRYLERACGGATSAARSLRSTGVDLADAMPGCGADSIEGIFACVGNVLTCHSCLQQSAVLGHSADCEILDDGTDNQSCQQPSL